MELILLEDIDRTEEAQAQVAHAAAQLELRSKLKPIKEMSRRSNTTEVNGSVVTPNRERSLKADSNRSIRGGFVLTEFGGESMPGTPLHLVGRGASGAGRSEASLRSSSEVTELNVRPQQSVTDPSVARDEVDPSFNISEDIRPNNNFEPPSESSPRSSNL